MKTLNEYIKEQEEQVFAVVDKDLDGAIMSVWNTNDEAEKEKADRLKENDKLNIEIKPMKKSEAETTK